SCESLIPYRMAACGSSGEWDAEVLGPWPSSALRKLKADLQERSGVRFRGWKAMRATFGQRAVNAGVPIEKVSRAMRHKYTQTTERFYARVSAGVALDAVNRAFDKPAIRQRPAEGGASSRWTNPHPSVVRRSREARYPTLGILHIRTSGAVRAWSNLQVEGTSKHREAIAHGREEDDFGGGGDGTTGRDGRTQPPQARTSSDRAHAKLLEVERSRRRGNRRRSGSPHTTREPHPAPSERGRILRRHDSVRARLLPASRERGPARHD